MASFILGVVKLGENSSYYILKSIHYMALYIKYTVYKVQSAILSEGTHRFAMSDL